MTSHEPTYLEGIGRDWLQLVAPWGGEQRRPCGMTLHLRFPTEPGVSEPPDFSDHVTWAQPVLSSELSTMA